METDGGTGSLDCIDVAASLHAEEDLALQPWYRSVTSNRRPQCEAGNVSEAVTVETKKKVYNADAQRMRMGMSLEEGMDLYRGRSQYQCSSKGQDKVRSRR